MDLNPYDTECHNTMFGYHVINLKFLISKNEFFNNDAINV
jgi:hypothetical protein